MSIKKCLAMVLAGGKGTRMAALTTKIAKPAIPFAGGHRLIDFTLSNCYNSGLDIVGVLTPGTAFDLGDQIGPEKAGLQTGCRLHILNPRYGRISRNSYSGTANAIFENLDFIDRFRPQLVLVLAGDHIYKMNYNKLIDYHQTKGAAATISVVEVPWAEAARFGILTTGPDGAIVQFTEKPAVPKSNLASMGVYIFSWPLLREYLMADNTAVTSRHDFGHDIIPAMLNRHEKLYAYPFQGYWKDVGNVESFHKAHMDLLADPPAFKLQDPVWPVYASLPAILPAICSTGGSRSLISRESSVFGEVNGAVIFPNVYLGKNSRVINSVVMAGAYVGPEAYVEQAIIGPGAVVENGCSIRGGTGKNSPVAIVGEDAVRFAVQMQVGG